MKLFGVDIYKDCENQIMKYYDSMLLCKDLEEKVKILDDLYKYIKMITPEFYDYGQMSLYYKKFQSLVFRCESILDEHFLIPNNPLVKCVSMPNLSSDNYSAILDYIVFETRKYLLKLCINGDLSKTHLANCCTISNAKVLSLMDHLGYEDCSYSVILTPGFVDKPQLFDGSGYHCMTILNLGSKHFLIDCTYSQFFTVSRNSLERLGLVNFMNCKPGKFMTMNDERLDVADTLLTRGWIELNDKTLKNYMDGFALFYRNGLYYELSEDYSYTTDYSSKDYLRFLQNKDSQLNHEKKYVLGYQRVPSSKYL